MIDAGWAPLQCTASCPVDHDISAATAAIASSATVRNTQSAARAASEAADLAAQPGMRRATCSAGAPRRLATATTGYAAPLNALARTVPKRPTPTMAIRGRPA